jgi:hypothetical protein
MIKYRKESRIRNLVGAIVFAVATTLLWVESAATAPGPEGDEARSVQVQEAASIRAAEAPTLDHI